jgi:hypothetical protein
MVPPVKPGDDRFIKPGDDRFIKPGDDRFIIYMNIS